MSDKMKVTFFGLVLKTCMDFGMTPKQVAELFSAHNIKAGYKILEGKP